MLKVVKFGGSSLADAAQFEKVRQIITADPARRVVVVSAPGKRFSADHKITDLLYLCYAHLQYGVSAEGVFSMVVERYRSIVADCGLSADIDKEFLALYEKMQQGISWSPAANISLPALWRNTSALIFSMPPNGSSFPSMAKLTGSIPTKGFAA